jgi:hypothetical protein
MELRQVREAELWLTRIFFFRTLSEMIQKKSDLNISWAPSGPHQEQNKKWEIRGNDCQNVSVDPSGFGFEAFDLASSRLLDKLGFKSGKA